MLKPRASPSPPRSAPSLKFRRRPAMWSVQHPLPGFSAPLPNWYPSFYLLLNRATPAEDTPPSLSLCTAQRPLVRVAVGPSGWGEPASARGRRSPWALGALLTQESCPEPRRIWFNRQVSAVGAGSEHEMTPWRG